MGSNSKDQLSQRILDVCQAICSTVGRYGLCGQCRSAYPLAARALPVNEPTIAWLLCHSRWCQHDDLSMLTCAPLSVCPTGVGVRHHDRALIDRHWIQSDAKLGCILNMLQRLVQTVKVSVGRLLSSIGQ